MPWSTSNRRARLPSGWATIRLRILARDGRRCRALLPSGAVCGALANEVDHVVAGDDHSDPNLRAICGWCHRRKSSAEGAAARGQRRLVGRETEQHPGAYRE